MRALPAALLVVAALFGACSNGPDRYASAAELAAALRAEDVSCESYAAGRGAELLGERASCTSGSGELDIYIFEDTSARDRWLQVGSGLEGVVVGPNWVVDAAGRARVVAEALGGRLR